MPVVNILSSATTNQTVLLSTLLSTFTPPLLPPLQTLVGIYIHGTIDTGSVLTQIQNPIDSSWVTIEDLSWRNAYPDGSGEIPLPPGGTDGSTYYVIAWNFRFVLSGVSGLTNVNLSMNW